MTMWSFLLRRLLWGLLIVLGVSVIVFLLFYVLPTGDPAAIRAGRYASPEQIAQVRHALGLDRSLPVQYGIFLWNLVAHLDLGFSYQHLAPVKDLIRERLPVTLALVAGAAVIWLVVGVGAGVVAAARPGSLFDRAAGFGSLALLSAPVFWLGYIALILFSAGVGSLLPVLPGIGAYLGAEALPQRIEALILPWFVLGLSSAAAYVRLTRAVVSEELARPYVTAAHARGLPERRVLWVHAARTGMAPLIGLIGLDLGLILAGNVVLVETVFNLPGLGRLLTESIERSDLPLTQGIVLVSACFIVLVTVLVDLIHATLDPRTRR